MAVGRECLELLLGQIGLRVQFFEVPFVEFSGDGLIDTLCNRVLPELRVLLYVSEAMNFPGARKDMSFDRRETWGTDSQRVSNSTRIPGDKVEETLGIFIECLAEMCGGICPRDARST